MKPFWRAREFSTVAILLAEVLFFTWYLWPEAGRSHPFMNLGNVLLIFKYSSIYGIAAIGAAIVIISGGIDLAPGAVIALTTVVVGYLFVEAGWPLWAGAIAGLMLGAAAGLLSSWLIVRVKLPPFIATLGVMGILRGTAFIVTEARFYDLSAKLPHELARRRRVDRLARSRRDDRARHRVSAPDDRVSVGPEHLRRRRQRDGGALLRRAGRPDQDVARTSCPDSLAAVSGVVLAVVQGQGKADLASGYELDIIASAVVGGASLVGGRGSVAGAVLGALIFGVLRNALPQIPGATFYDRLIVGVVVIGIVVMDQVLTRAVDRRVESPPDGAE